jgi:N-acetylglucosamine kinase-like BadF-type ATPase
MPLYLAIDGGGTQTTCVVANQGEELARVVGPGSNPVRVGEDQARQALHKVILEACARAGSDPAHVGAVCIGVAGAARAQTAESVRAMIAEQCAGVIRVVGDHDIALEAAFGSASGLVVIAGTGSIAFGRNGRGQKARAGGWGFAVSDEGSAHWVGRDAVRAAMHAHDAGDTTILVSSIMNTWHLGTRDDVVRFANRIPPPDFAELFPAVLAAAQAGDSLAREIIMRAGSELAQLAKMVVRRLWPGESAAIGVAMVGGVFRASALVRQIFSNSLRSEYPLLQVRPGVVDPVLGALALARRG